MATAQKNSRKRSAPRNRPRARPSELAILIREVSRISLALDELLGAGLLATARAERRRRTPLPEYARVVAIGDADEAAEIRGRTGIVLGTDNSEGAWTYTVYFPARQETFVLHGESLWDTGEDVPEDVIYGGGERRRVRVDKVGKGTLVA